jgi:hypothetical protein
VRDGYRKVHYSPGLIRHGSDLSRKEIDEIDEELASLDQRGAVDEPETQDRFQNDDLYMIAFAMLLPDTSDELRSSG